LSTAHSGERPFFCPCENCGHSFARSSELKRHLCVHTKERPFVCPHEGCGKGFVRASGREKHLRVHTAEKPFACSFEGCGQAFTRRDLLAQHVRSCTKAGSFVRLRKQRTNSATPSRVSARLALARRKKAPLFQRTEAGKQQPVTTQHPPAPVFAAAAGRRWKHRSSGAPAPSPGSGLSAHRDRPRSIATASPGVSEPCDRSLAPSAWDEQRSPGLNRPPAPPSPIAQLEWAQSLSATQGSLPDWSPWCADDHLYGDWLSLFGASASDLEVPSSLLADDDKGFWQALISPATSEARHSAC